MHRTNSPTDYAKTRLTRTKYKQLHELDYRQSFSLHLGFRISGF